MFVHKSYHHFFYIFQNFLIIYIFSNIMQHFYIRIIIFIFFFYILWLKL